MHVAWNGTSWSLEREDTGDVTETKILILSGNVYLKLYSHNECLLYETDALLIQIINNPHLL
jgi:hypothetical protein